MRSFDSHALTRSDRPSSTAMNNEKRSRRASGPQQAGNGTTRCGRRARTTTPWRSTVENRSNAPAMASQAIHIIGTMTIAARTERGVLDEVGLVGEVVDDAEQGVAAGDLEQEPLEGHEAGADDEADGQHQRRVAAVAGPERVADAHDVPLAGRVAPRQPVVLGHDRQLVGGPFGEPEGGGVGERPAGAVGGARPTAPSKPRGSIHARTPSQCCGPHEAVRASGAGPWTRMRLTDARRDERRWRCRRRTATARDGQRVGDGDSASPLRTDRHHSSPLSTQRDGRRTERRARPSGACDSPGRRASAHDGPGEPAPPASGQPQPGDLDAGARTRRSACRPSAGGCG